MPCNRCGQCCTTVTFILAGVESDDDPQEFQRYVSFHRCQVYRATQEGKPDVMGVKLPIVCRHLDFDGNTGQSSCAIYKDRPQICKDFLCNAAKLP